MRGVPRVYYDQAYSCLIHFYKRFQIKLLLPGPKVGPIKLLRRPVLRQILYKVQIMLNSCGYFQIKVRVASDIVIFDSSSYVTLMSFAKF